MQILQEAHVACASNGLGSNPCGRNLGPAWSARGLETGRWIDLDRTVPMAPTNVSLDMTSSARLGLWLSVPAPEAGSGLRGSCRVAHVEHSP